MFTVVNRFADTQDDKCVYEVGATYPREGFEPTEARIAALVSGKKGKLNKTGKVYLEPALDPETEPGTEPEPEQ